MTKHRWFTPNTYDTNFKNPPNAPGIYCIKEIEFCEDTLKYSKEKRIVYIGSTVNLKQRYRQHEVIRKLYALYPKNIYQFYFKAVNHGFYDLEISLIKRLQPPYNKAHKNG